MLYSIEYRRGWMLWWYQHMYWRSISRN